MIKFIQKIKGFFGYEGVIIHKTGSVGPSEATASLLTMLSANRYDTSKDILVLPRDYKGVLPVSVGPIIRVSVQKPAIIKTGYSNKK